MIVLYVLAYLFVGSVVHWAADRLAKKFDNNDSLDTGSSFILVLIMWPVMLVMILFLHAPRYLENEDIYKSLHDFYDEIWNNLTS